LGGGCSGDGSEQKERGAVQNHRDSSLGRITKISK
jgi:hypothetical protein